MPRLTLRTLLAYIDDTLEPTEARALGKKVAESDEARQLVDRIKKVTRRRGLATPVPDDEDDTTADPNTVAAYLDNALDSATLRQVEETCLESDVHLAEVAACHQILTLVLTEPVRVPPRAHRRMYALVKRPASVPGRRPGRTLPISGATPPAAGPGDADDDDAALLLGMKRYSATTTWAARFALFGAAAVLLVLLAGAVLKVWLPPGASNPPELARWSPPASVDPKPAPAPAPGASGPAVAPAPSDAKKGPPSEDSKKASDVATAPMPAPRPIDSEEVVIAPPVPVPVPAPEPDPWEKIVLPSLRRVAVGRLNTERVLVVSYRNEPGAVGTWGRLAFKPATDNPDKDSVFATDPVMALPGYKADVLLGEPNKPVVEVHLWGNAPEQLPYRVLESKVTFHQPAPEFDADLTLHTGRIYLKNKKPAADKKSVEAKVRVRLANTKEVWDVTLPDESTDVLVELISWFKPGTPYAVTGGDEPKREARVAVVNGAAGFQATGNRFKKVDRVTADTQLAWDSVTGVLSEPTPANPQDTKRVPVLDGNFQKILTRVLTEAADAVTGPERVRTVMKVRLDPPEAMQPRDLVARLAIYSWAAMAESTEDGCKTLQDLVEILNSELPWLSRQAAVTALVHWVAREKGNTALIHALFSKPGGIAPPSTVDAVVEMLRGYISPVKLEPGDAERLDRLVERLGGARANEFDKPEKAIALRDVALWYLAAADQGLWIPPPIGVNVGAVGAKFDSEEYKKFIAFWKTHVEAIKKRPPPMPKVP